MMRCIRLIIAQVRESAKSAREIDRFARTMERLSDDAQALGWECVATLDAMIKAGKREELHMGITNRVREIIKEGEMHPGAGQFVIDTGAMDEICGLIDSLESELESRRLAMAEQERIANMPRAYSVGG